MMRLGHTLAGHSSGSWARGWLACCILLTLLCPAFAAGAATIKCNDLAKLPIDNGRVLTATSLADGLPAADIPPSRGPNGTYIDPAFAQLPRFCRLSATLTPVPGSHIGVELWLPDTWNGKLLALGNHGFGGEFERADMAMGLHRGYAVVATDAGHSAPYSTAGGFSVGSAAFAAHGDAVAIDDYSWRAVHESALAAKVIVARYYGIAAKRAYFDGCSKGGGQAMREAQQFPNDFDGIIAGSAAMYATRLMASDLWAAKLGDLGGGVRITPAKLQLAQKAAVVACDKLDGLADGVVVDVAHCVWHPEALRCKPSQSGAECLTDGEVAAITRAEQPLRDPKTGEMLYEGFAPASEARWISPLGNMGGPNPVTAAYFRDMVVRDPKWSAQDADPVALLRQSENSRDPVSRTNAVDPDLSNFRKAGGKLIQYHGWADEAMVPGYTAHYYMQVIDLQGGADPIAKTQKFYRLFMVPGMGHCAGGSVPVNFGALSQPPATPVDADHDILEALDRWVEQGKAPDRLIASTSNNPATAPRQMPLCPFPSIATYVEGDINSAASFACRPSRQKDRGL